ncbi:MULTISPECIES: type VI secretion system tube protein Hcp [Paraburkholderia]|uniref:Type VI secretion system secreted protein Hcp n=1 Tax=Paraburkholderia megapolitana TaxID=420953 RepID=A0A1I3TD33_9BURK|nr:MULTISPECIES: type VI secretion system tube protein Hcp [Paraburkholderia]MCX4165007.1 type VI secretion system tube protein Hcp [Paraburkholderia megapolitana]MDN7160500.1 type VI secretion system tube protein Hcp [Paraburkholderia sp. CHISQ3]MDQ6497547.1 type VI secretion system tube protein Hcp [Paraburkholderia megapolitana]QDQ81490.1 type VI secretion system tube protein Hcp [Paraburkholderia megapolitana]SFJ67397.1 type VI secretion system secreted protein Hcp [Paraburkholderia megapo
MANKDIYLKFGSPAIQGESADKDHGKWIECTSWSHSILQPRSATTSSSGGGTSERCEHSDMRFTKEMDLVSPLLYQHASGGTTFDEVTVDFMRADGEGKRVKYMQLKMKYVIISSVTPSVVGEGLPTEEFSLKYAAVQWTYTQQNVGGGQGGNVQGAWSLTKNDKTYAV